MRLVLPDGAEADGPETTPRPVLLRYPQERADIAARCTELGANLWRSHTEADTRAGIWSHVSGEACDRSDLTSRYRLEL